MTCAHRCVVDIEPAMQAVDAAAPVRTLLEHLKRNAWTSIGGRDPAHIAIGVARTTADHVECCVRDDGAGFAPEHADRLFRAFQRLNAQDEFAGHGIGLAAVKRTRECHGGTIRAEGKPHAGATFSSPCRAWHRPTEVGSSIASPHSLRGEWTMRRVDDQALRLCARITRCLSRAQSRSLLASRLS